jgi:[protein-PII] uridylyltransferase
MRTTPVGTAGGFPELPARLLGRAGVTGPVRRRALSRLTDGWLGELAQEAGVNVGGVALVAVGGYGRGELGPFSDLDLMLLHSTETPASYAGMLAERMWYPIWDSKIRLDHSVRSVGGARQIARTDLPAMLGMLDLRHIAGDPELAVTLHRRVLADWRADAKNRLAALRDRCAERAERSGALAFATTPDLKESRGGLRDLVVMRAVAASWVADCPHHGLEEARSALLDVRDVLQALAGRATDRLQVQDQACR